MRYLIITIIIIIVITILYKIRGDDLVYIKSDIDDKDYLVRDLSDKQRASNMLARISNNIIKLTKHLNDNKEGDYIKYKVYIEQLVDKIEGVVIRESEKNSQYTSYSVNKGEQLVFCVRSKDRKNHIHDLNLLMYVVLHEMAHVACPEYGHTPLFKYIFAFFTEVGIKMRMYNKISFEENPMEYCGLTISESII
jgi:hypothetical protein